jgi:hypothetical protein
MPCERWWKQIKSVNVTATDPNIQEIGPNREFQQAAFRLSQGQPFALSIRNNQVHLLHLKRRYFPKPEKEKETKARARLAQQMEQEWRQYFLASALQQMREKSRVKVLIPEMLVTPAAPPPERRG